jgi:hypothetical protein
MDHSQAAAVAIQSLGFGRLMIFLPGYYFDSGSPTDFDTNWEVQDSPLTGPDFIQLSATQDQSA